MCSLSLQKNNDGQKNRLDGLEQQQPTRNTSGSQKPVKEKTEPKKPITDKNAKVIRGVTFYKAEGESYNEDDEKGKGRNCKSRVQCEFIHHIMLKNHHNVSNPLLNRLLFVKCCLRTLSGVHHGAFV